MITGMTEEEFDKFCKDFNEKHCQYVKIIQEIPGLTFDSFIRNCQLYDLKRKIERINEKEEK